MKKGNFTKVQKVLPESIADEAGIEQGDILVSINGEKIKDVFDYRFLCANEELILEIMKDDEEIWEIEIEKDEYEDLGIEFESSMMDECRNCTNKCIFCFIDQLPQGMRDTLYFKDDDSRLSFLMGNYVTLTNMQNDDIDRIIRYKMSPINISVHTTNPDLRVLMLRNKFAGNIIPKIKKLVDGGITVNCQIVLCRDVNDGRELYRTISDLSELYPGVMSISIVPVGITKHRKGLHDLKPYDAETAREVLLQVGKQQKKLLRKHGSRIVYLADEFYIMADMDIPEYEHYEDFPQIENGVGLIAMLRYEFAESLDSLLVEGAGNESLSQPLVIREVSIATGVSAYKHIREMADTLEKSISNIKINVYAIKNNFFGENVTVTGLLTGFDLVDQLKEKELGSGLMICRCMLKAEEELFLDDYSVDRVEKELKINITVVENSGKDFVEKVTGMTI